MGFFDSFKKSFDDESQRMAESREYSSYRTVKQREQDRYDELGGQSDSTLLGKINGPFTSDEDKQIIDGILKRRGYNRAKNGSYHRL